MYYIGIDVGKFNHCACVVSSEGEVLIKPFFFTNNQDGFNSGDNLINFLITHGFEVALINPLTTDAKRKSKIRKTKNDKKDTFLICSVLFDRDYTRVTQHILYMKQARELTRYYASIAEDINQKKNQLQKCIDIVIPEFNTWLKTKCSKAYMAVLKEFGSSYNLASANLTHLKKVLKPKSSGSHVDIDASSLRASAKKSIGESNEIIALEIKTLIENIELSTSQLKTVDKKIEELAAKLDSPIFSIPGIGIYTRMSILSEIGDINNFSSAVKVMGFACVELGTYQSGEYIAPRTALSKRGSRYLRKSLYQCILPVFTNNLTFNKYYKLKRL